MLLSSCNSSAPALCKIVQPITTLLLSFSQYLVHYMVIPTQESLVGGCFIPVAPTWSIGHLFLIRHSVGLLGRAISPLQGRQLTQTLMPRMGLKPTIQVFQRTADTVIGTRVITK
jgi:hypothetical protein